MLRGDAVSIGKSRFSSTIIRQASRHGSATSEENIMRIRRLGSTGLKVSEICLGTMTFGHQCDEKTSFAIMDRAAEKGVTFLDTADVYPVPPTPETAGRTEEFVGRWLKGQR